VTGNNPISPDAFAAAVESLDRDALATLVAEVYEATADAVDVDGARVTASTDGRRTELTVLSAADEGVAADGADAVVVASDSLLDDAAEIDAEVVTPGDLRERLLYAVPTAEANAIADRTLGLPVRSATYDPVPGDAGGAAGDDANAPNADANVPNADGDAASGEGDTGGDQAGALSATPETAAANSTPGARTAAGSERSQPRDRPTDSADAIRGSGETATTATVGDRETASDRSDAETSTGRSYPRRVVAVVAVVALLVAAVGAGFVAGTAGVGIAGIGGDSTDAADAGSGPTGSTNGTDDGSGTTTADDDAANTAVITDGNLSDEAARNTAPTPTCERSALQVVQIQMNALRYNDNATNDGIRTLRAFASPDNREAVGSVEDYAQLFELPRYGPMLTYDTAQYSVPVIDDDTAEVEVVTRENGNVTGRYVFRLELVTGGSAGGDVILGDVDDCWMTDSVAGE
jgi:hypothetical protein